MTESLRNFSGMWLATSYSRKSWPAVISIMAGKVVDLSSQLDSIPEFCVVDTNVLISLFVPATSPTNARQRSQSQALRQHLEQEDKGGFVTPTTVAEIAHLFVKLEFTRELKNNLVKHEADLRNRFPGKARFDWLDLCKVYPRPFEAAAKSLQTACSQIRTSFVFLEPFDLSPNAPGTHQFTDLAAAIKRYRMDSNDASILIEARRAGISAIVSHDGDLRRASKDFDVYTWL
ncbi:MAG: type II toxin-antitoxin system VapC family toxin [Thermomicrobiales bacterium]